MSVTFISPISTIVAARGENLKEVLSKKKTKLDNISRIEREQELQKKAKQSRQLKEELLQEDDTVAMLQFFKYGIISDKSIYFPPIDDCIQNWAALFPQGEENESDEKQYIL